MIWALVFLAGLLFTKYYGETALRSLRSRTREDQKSLADARQALTAAQEEKAETEKEEKALKARLEKLQAIVTDLEAEIQESAIRTQKEFSLEMEKDGGEKEG